MAKNRNDWRARSLALLGTSVTSITRAFKSKVDEKKHAAHLRTKYPETVVQRMISERVWQGQTSTELADSLGSPSSVDRKLLATRTREIWKYYPRGVNRYGLRITLDDGMVVGWDSKG
jgi:hypothetical protein